MPSITILLADDNEFVRKGIRLTLESDPDLAIAVVLATARDRKPLLAGGVSSMLPRSVSPCRRNGFVPEWPRSPPPHQCGYYPLLMMQSSSLTDCSRGRQSLTDPPSGDRPLHVHSVRSHHYQESSLDFWSHHGVHSPYR